MTGIYTIQCGDTLWKIAQANGTTVRELARINNIENPDLIFAGADLKLKEDVFEVEDKPQAEPAPVVRESIAERAQRLADEKRVQLAAEQKPPEAVAAVAEEPDKTAVAAGLRTTLQELKNQQGVIGKGFDGIKNLTGLGAGSNNVEKAIKAYEDGTISLDEAAKTIENYFNSQRSGDYGGGFDNSIRRNTDSCGSGFDCGCGRKCNGCGKRC